MTQKIKQQNKMVFKKIIVMMLILFVGVSAVSAVTSSGLSVVLSNQNPDPVSPGNFVYLNVKVSNSGSQNINNAKIKFVENSNFKIASGESLTQELGTISAYSSNDNNNLVVAKYKVLVDDKAPLGLNTVNFEVSTGSQTYSYEFEVLVQDQNPTLYVKDIVAQKVAPGEETQLKINLENINSVPLKNVKIALDLSEVKDSAISMAKGSNEKIINTIDANKESEMLFDIAINPEADSVPYLLPIKITYEDSLENTYENTVYGTVKVFSPPVLSLNLDSQDVYTVGRGKVSLAIANPGSSKIKGVQIKVLPSDDYEVIEGENQYVGDLNPDDFQTLQTEVYVKNSQEASLKVELQYADSYDVQQKEIIDVPLKIYSESQLQELGFKGAQGGSTSGFMYLIVGVLLIVIIVMWRRSRKKAHLKNARN